MLDDTDFKTILDHYHRSWRGYRKVRKGPKKRISQHMEELGCRNVAEYLELLAGAPQEEEKLLFFLRITISRFFRDRRLWSSLVSEVFPALLERADNLRIWSAGCSCGEEVYSLCILHHLHWAGISSIEILATDANTSCLERAENGVYQKSSLREVDSELLKNYFSPAGRRHEYIITPMFRKNIVWARHDFLAEPPDQKFHVILLRNNLLTYHTPPVQSLALARILRSLMPDGFLVTGSHETLPELPVNLVPMEYCDMIYQLKD